MFDKLHPFYLVIFLGILAIGDRLSAQSWNFIKKKDGIKVYTLFEPGKMLKSYKAVATIKAPAEKVYSLIEDINHTEWWDKNLTQVKVLLYEKNKRARYYLVYDLPWPAADRDLCADVTVTVNSKTGESKIEAVPFSGVVPDINNLVRINDYRQTWIVRPLGKDSAYLEVNGYVDPGGGLPSWILNLLIVDYPINSINGVRKQVEK